MFDQSTGFLFRPSPKFLGVSNPLKPSPRDLLRRPAYRTGAHGPDLWLADRLIPALPRVPGLTSGDVHPDLDLAIDQEVHMQNLDARDALERDVDRREPPGF